MPGDHFWLGVEPLAAAFDDDDESVEENLSIYEQRAAQLPAEERGELKRHLAQIISGLARLSLRMQQRDGR